MIESYLFPIRYALLTFPIAALLFTLPFLIIQYRMYGYVNKFRGFVVYSALLYLITAYYLVILPLPDTTHTCTASGNTFTQWIPFQFVQDFWRETALDIHNPSTYAVLFKERAVLQVLFNVLLLVPLGMFLRYYFRFSFLWTTAAAFGLSLFFEWTQYTGLYGFYDCPYRLFDIDDLMLNTIGGMLGYALMKLFSKVLPSMDQLDDKVDLSLIRVGYVRRFIAFQIDWVTLIPFAVFLYFFGNPIYFAALVVAYFIILPYMTNGFTLGKYIVRIRLAGRGDRIRLTELIVRYGLLYFLLGGIHALGLYAAVQYHSSIIMWMILVPLLAVDILFAGHLAYRLYNREKGLFYETKSGTRHIVS